VVGEKKGKTGNPQLIRKCPSTKAKKKKRKRKRTGSEHAPGKKDDLGNARGPKPPHGRF